MSKTQPQMLLCTCQEITPCTELSAIGTSQHPPPRAEMEYGRPQVTKVDIIATYGHEAHGAFFDSRHQDGNNPTFHVAPRIVNVEVVADTDHRDL